MEFRKRSNNKKTGIEMRKIGYSALSLYLLLVALTATIPNLLVPMSLMASLAFIASLFIFLDVWLPIKK